MSGPQPSLVVLSELSPQLRPSASLTDLARNETAARLQGVPVYSMPADFARCGDAVGALAHLPRFAREVVGVWIGYIPEPARYRVIYDAALDKGIRLINSPDEHLRCQELDRALPLLGDLTPQSVTIQSVDECDAAIAALGLPLFVKGAVQSLKASGWRACVAETSDELRRLVTRILSLPDRARGHVVVRTLVPLRHSRKLPSGFPMGREFRVFLYAAEVVALGFYWDCDDPLARLTDAEQSAVRALAVEAAKRVSSPWITVDVAEREDGGWIVIETGDAQFSGLSCVEPLVLWHRLTRLTESRID